MPKPKKSKPKKSKPRKPKQPKVKKVANDKYMGYLLWLRVDLWKKTGAKAAEAIAKVRDELLASLKEELEAKTVVLREDQPKDTIPYVLLNLDKTALEDRTIGADNLMSKLQTSELVEWIEVERYAGITYGDAQ
jgi:hypothetical protein